MTDVAARELRAETTIAAPPAKVWAALTDLSNMPEWSTELIKMVPLKPGGLKLGQQYLGLNRRKAMIWPTRNVVADLQPEKSLAWDTKTSGARWIYELSPEGAGTKIVHRRPVPKKLTLVSRLFAPVALGGNEGHAEELEGHMATTLQRIKATVED